MKEGIMKATQQLSNNMMQSVAIHQKKLENQFLLRTRAGKSFENEMNLIKNLIIINLKSQILRQLIIEEIIEKATFLKHK